MGHDSLAHEVKKNFHSKIFPLGRFLMPDPAAHVTRVGTTPTLAVHPASQELDRPIHRSITCHSAIQVVSPKCPWPPHLAPCHSVLKTRINSQLVESISESLSTISSIVPTCVTITVPPATTSAVVTIIHCEKSHIARNCDPTSVDCTATTPR